MKQLKIGNSWVRGVVGNGLSTGLVTDFACAFGTHAGSGKRIVLARDTRSSSPMFSRAAAAGLLSAGIDVLNAGICPTPVAQYLVQKQKAAGAIVVTGSHNDASWNALKFINADGALFNPIEGEEMLDLYHLGEYTKAVWNEVGAEKPLETYHQEYLADTLAKLDVESIREADFKLIFDVANGTAGAFIHDFCRLLDCEYILINEETTGDFAHSPAPTPSNMYQLTSLLKNVDADAGFALNTDADRVGIVTENGTAKSEEYTFPLVANHILRKEPGTVVTNLSTSRMIEHVVKSHKSSLVRTKIGEGNIVFRAMNENAIVGGEGSGGVVYMPVSRSFDGFVTIALILEAMAQRAMKLSALCNELPRLHMRKGTIPCSPDRTYYALEEIRDLYRKDTLDLSDGVRVEKPDIWLHVRSSNTEPLLRVIVEGTGEAAVEDCFTDTMSRVNTIVHGKS